MCIISISNSLSLDMLYCNMVCVYNVKKKKPVINGRTLRISAGCCHFMDQ